MKGYLSIGKVSKLKNVSIKSLRYYDRIGVFCPAYINEETNYRYYTEEQLYLLDAIQLCIELGIPLSRFEEYRDSDGSLNIQKLLFDGKDLAEKKIRSMRKTIDQLQSTLNRLGGKAPGPVKPSKAAKAAKPSTEVDKAAASVLPQRCVILAEFDEVTTATRYNHMLLSLFVNAERSGLNAGYPTGLIYDHQNGETKQYVFATLTGADPAALGSNCRVLPEGSYYTHRSKEHCIEDAGNIFDGILSAHKGQSYTLIESDVVEGKQKGMKELQLLL